MKYETINDNLIVKLTFDFALLIIKYCEKLENNKKFILSNQLLRCGTSIGSNTWEAQNAESKADFIHKFKISAKEMEETKYRLLLCKHSENYPDTTLLLNDLEQIEKIITKIIFIKKIN
jgi:four helix bundle protein